MDERLCTSKSIDQSDDDRLGIRNIKKQIS